MVKSSSVALNVNVEGVFRKEAKYKNSKRAVLICEQYREFIGLLAELNECDVSQIANNMLSVYFSNEQAMSQLKAFAKEKYKERMQQLNNL
ncbi:MAG: hypothetical protein LBK47_08470 [Prevotellaceae bacterium]|jgi:hypothetical protein|nr:hypothetical protein [Prevotellaceae bacterium]